MATIMIEKECGLCGAKREGDDVYHQCICLSRPEYSPADEKTIKSEIEAFRTLYADKVEKASTHALLALIGYFCSISQDARDLINPRSNADMFVDINRDIRRCRNYSGTDEGIAKRCLELLYILPNNARLIGYTDCLFVANGSPCSAKFCGGLCSTHIGWLYIAHNELASELPLCLTETCIEYIHVDYYSVPACVPNAKKRK